MDYSSPDSDNQRMQRADLLFYRRKKTCFFKQVYKMVGERGFEPPTHWSQTSCATKLRYSPIIFIVLFCLVRREGLEPSRPLRH